MNNVRTNTQDKIQFNFTCYALRLLGRNLYTNPWTAISELVANGIDAKASVVYVLVDISNKKHAQIEIIDNGFGMSYEDLCDKYTIIGRNKRLGVPEDKSTLGRKGIGKLAALYLSPKYYLCTKTNQDKSSWIVDVTNIKDEDTPSLDRVRENVSCVSQEIWDNLNSGTLVKLLDVDLQKIGEERLKALPIILADYYLPERIACRIKVCIKKDDSQPLNFVDAHKKISFDTLYSIFDNTEQAYYKRMLSNVYVTKPYELPAVLDKSRPSLFIRTFPNTSGIVEVKNLAGEVIKAEYDLNGWIGIHCSLETEVLRRNNKNYNKVIYHHNALRLYVRGKLAVDNLMTYVGSSQAFANYIEGEINFDVLDDDRFEDISTSSREGYKKDDPRIKKLLDVVSKIVGKLIRDRVEIGSKINKEYKDYIEEEKRKERERIREVEEKLNSANQIAESALLEKEKAEQEVVKERKRIDYIVGVSNVKDNNILPSMHSIFNLACLGKKKLAKFEKYLSTLPSKLVGNIEALGEINNQILYISKAVSKSNYLVDSEEKEIDLADYISEYIFRIAKKIYGSKIKITVSDNLETRLVKKMATINLVTIIENIIGNAIKANADKLDITFYNDDKSIYFKFADNGEGLDKSINEIDRIFEFGVTTTSGAGLGLYYSQIYVENIDGKLYAEQNKDNGLSIIAKF